MAAFGEAKGKGKFTRKGKRKSKLAKSNVGHDWLKSEQMSSMWRSRTLGRRSPMQVSRRREQATTDSAEICDYGVLFESSESETGRVWREERKLREKWGQLNSTHVKRFQAPAPWKKPAFSGSSGSGGSLRQDSFGTWCSGRERCLRPGDILQRARVDLV